MNSFWQKYKNKIIPVLRYATPVLLLFICLAFPATTYAWEWPNFLKSAGSAIVSLKDAVLNPIQWGVEATVGLVFFLLSTTVLLIVKSFYWIAMSLLSQLIEFSLSNKAVNISAITLGWGLVRDFANLGLIFILLYVSITTVLGLNGSNTYKMLGKVIFVGLLMNFSLVFTNLVIDSSNIIGLQFMKAINGSADIGVLGSHKDYVGGIGERLGQSLGVANLMGLDQNTGNSTNFNKGLKMLGVSGILIMVVFVLGAGASIFMVRIVKLMGIAIFSPLAFVSIILPKTEGLATRWWGELAGNAFLAPAYLFMIYISLSITATFLPNDIANPADPKAAKMTDVLDFFNETQSQATADAQADANIKTIMGFALTFGLLSSATAVAVHMAAGTVKAGGELSKKVIAGTAKVGKMAVGYASGGVSGAIQSGASTNISGALGLSPDRLKQINAATSSMPGVGKYIPKIPESVNLKALNEGGMSGGIKKMNELTSKIPGIGSKLQVSEDALKGKLGAAANVGKKASFDIQGIGEIKVGGVKLGDAIPGLASGLAFGSDRKYGGAGGYEKEQADKRAEAASEKKAEKAAERKEANAGFRAKINDPVQLAAMPEAELRSGMDNLNREELLEEAGGDMSDPKKKRFFESLNFNQTKTVMENAGWDDTNKAELKKLSIQRQKENPGSYGYFKKDEEERVFNEKVKTAEESISALQLDLASGDAALMADAEKAMGDLVTGSEDAVIVALKDDTRRNPAVAKHFDGAQLQAQLKAGKLNTATDRRITGEAIRSNPANTSGNDFIDTPAGRVLGIKQASTGTDPYDQSGMD